MFPIKYIDNNLVWNKDNEVFAYYELIPYNYSFLSAEQKFIVHDSFRQLIAQSREGKIHALQIATESSIRSMQEQSKKLVTGKLKEVAYQKIDEQTEALVSMIGDNQVDYRFFLNYRSTGWRRVFAVIITFHFVCFCWIFFRNTEFEGSVSMIRQIFTSFHPELFVQLVEGYWKVFVLMGIGYVLHWCPDSWQNACSRGMTRMPLVGQALILIALIFLVIQVKSSDIQPFIYFQF